MNRPHLTMAEKDKRRQENLRIRPALSIHPAIKGTYMWLEDMQNSSPTHQSQVMPA